ncbi:MAG: proline dehydrogenase family protein [Bacteroidales bacterium]|nr:proline dehydrogenase family protein [Bacteroidales bacterium]
MNFELTDIAYSFYSNKKLKKKRIFLKIMRINAFIRSGKFLLKLFFALNLPVEWIFKKTIFPLFCGGENLKLSLKLVNDLGKKNILSVLDFSVEGLSNEKSFNDTFIEVKNSIINASNNQYIPFAVFKPTAIAKHDVLTGKLPVESVDYQNFRHRLIELSKYAAEHDVKLMIDAEDFAFQSVVDKEVELLMHRFNKEKTIVYTTIQMYRWDRTTYLHYLIDKAKSEMFFVGIKLVRGAYLEKENNLAQKGNYKSPIYSTKEETDEAYNNALLKIVNNINICELFAGTHNEESCMLLSNNILKTGLRKNDKRVYFAQLYGMSDNISMVLANQGYNVVKYIPYGPVKEVIPYLLRRAEENSSISKQSKKEIYLINKELKRRKNDNKQ